METEAYARAMSSQNHVQADKDAEQALLQGFLKTDNDLLARQLGQMQLSQQEHVHHAKEQLLQLQLQKAAAVPTAAGSSRSRLRRGHSSSWSAGREPERVHSLGAAGEHAVEDQDVAGDSDVSTSVLGARDRAVIRLTQPPPPSLSGCCGTTALVLMLRSDSTRREHLHVAWLGDCRAVLCRAGVAEVLTCEHNVTIDSERRRVLLAGGEVEAGRLSGFLQVSRALGDLDCATGRKPLGLSCVPELSSREVQPQDEFVIVGTDGLWDCITTADAVRLARNELRAYADASMASEKLVEVALKRHADDNVTAVVVLLNAIADPPAAPEHDKRRPRPLLATRRRGASLADLVAAEEAATALGMAREIPEVVEQGASTSES